jgi:hypothetical protein
MKTAVQVFRHFTRTHLHVFLILYVVFAGLSLLALTRQSASDWRHNWNLAATIGSFSGPFAGAIARNFQSCCWKFSVSLFPYCAAFLLGGGLLQFVPIPWSSAERPVRLTAWVIGLLGWFGGVVVSYAHALS